jgi:uncharacterized protein YhaN
MKIKEFFIRRYGPISHKNKISLTNFNLIWGKNEEGKTLTIDALVKLLLGRNIQDFEHIDRVDENPEGYVIIEDDKGKEIKLPEKGDLTKFLDLTPSECCNIFIVRNSNLSIARDVAQESEFYTNVTDRLTGLRTGEIYKIKEFLREVGKITPTGAFRDIKDEKLKTSIEDAKNLIEEIESLGKEIKEKKFDELEEKSAKQREKIEGIEQGIKSLEDARKREKYEKGKKALDKLEGALERYKQLEIYNEDDEQLWREYEKDLKNFDEEKKNTLAELKKNEEELKETIEKLSEVERDFRVFDDRKKKIDDEVKPELKNYEMGVGKVKSEETKNRFYTVAAITSAVLLSISILGAIMNPSLIFYVLIVSFLISTGVFAALRFSFTQKKAHLAAVFERIRLVISRFELDAESPKEIYSNIQKFGEEYQKKYEELQDIKRKKENLDDKNRELQNRTIPAIEKKIKDAEEKIDEIKVKSREGSLEQYTGKLKLKQELERSAEEQKSILKSHFEEKSKKWEENISQWDEEIGNLEEYKDRARDIKYSETTASELEEKKQEFKEELEEMDNRMGSLQKEMGTVQRKANEILRLEGEYLYCKTSVDLKAINDKLQGFIDENESNKDNVLEVMKIFEEIEAEEKEKVSELFGKDSPIPKYFSEITDGLYEEVTFNQGTGKIEVKRRDGKILEAEKLSGGAYDQLYFSIRLALGEKLLKGEKGFFVMDDPFVKADPDRLQRQIEMLKKIYELGWQVMYFSAKGEIRDVLEEDIKKGAINNVEIQGIFS